MTTIKIIDDDKEMAEYLATTLESAGYQTSTRLTTDMAVEDLAQNTPDLLILDVMFPDNPAAGFDLARKIRQTEAIKDLPIILMTSVNQHFPMGFSANDIDPDWMPVQDFVEKPVTPRRLLEAVRKMLG